MSRPLDDRPLKAPFVFVADDETSEKSAAVLRELEFIDDETDQHGILFVKIDDLEVRQCFHVMILHRLTQTTAGGEELRHRSERDPESGLLREPNSQLLYGRLVERKGRARLAGSSEVNRRDRRRQVCVSNY